MEHEAGSREARGRGEGTAVIKGRNGKFLGYDSSSSRLSELRMGRR